MPQFCWFSHNLSVFFTSNKINKNNTTPLGQFQNQIEKSQNRDAIGTLNTHIHDRPLS